MKSESAYKKKAAEYAWGLMEFTAKISQGVIYLEFNIEFN